MTRRAPGIRWRYQLYLSSAARRFLGRGLKLLREIGQHAGARFVPRSDRILSSPKDIKSDEQPLKYICVHPGFRRFVDTVPQQAVAVPSMISIAEKRLLFGLAERYCRGEGIIVDAGIFLGASTRCFGEGLKRNASRERMRALRERPILSFEKGDITPTMAAFLCTNHADLFGAVGVNFIEHTKRNIQGIEDLVELRVGDILDDPLDIDCPIEICFLDILKSPAISLHCFTRLVPLLIPGRSIVLHQDYFYEKLPYIKVHQEFLRDHFDFIGEVGSTAIFRLASPVPTEKLAALARVGAEEQLMLASVALQRSRDPYRRLMMSLSRLRLVGKFRGRKEAARQLELVKVEYSEQVSHPAPLRIIDALSEIEAFCQAHQEIDAPSIRS